MYPLHCDIAQRFKRFTNRESWASFNGYGKNRRVEWAPMSDLKGYALSVGPKRKKSKLIEKNKN